MFIMLPAVTAVVVAVPCYICGWICAVMFNDVKHYFFIKLYLIIIIPFIYIAQLLAYCLYRLTSSVAPSRVKTLNATRGAYVHVDYP